MLLAFAGGCAAQPPGTPRRGRERAAKTEGPEPQGEAPSAPAPRPSVRPSAGVPLVPPPSPPVALADHFERGGFGYESLGGAIIPLRVVLRPHWPRDLVIASIVSTLTGARRALPMSYPGESPPDLLDRLFWATLLEDLSGVEAAGHLGVRQPDEEAERSIAALVAAVQSRSGAWRGP